MKPETIIAAALLALWRRLDSLQVGFRSDVLTVLRELRHASFPLHGIRIRRTPYGLHSDEVSKFIGRLAMGGYLVQGSPIRLTDAGVSLLRNYVAEESATEEGSQLLEALGLSEELSVAP